MPVSGKTSSFHHWRYVLSLQMLLGLRRQYEPCTSRQCIRKAKTTTDPSTLDGWTPCGLARAHHSVKSSTTEGRRKGIQAASLPLVVLIATLNNIQLDQLSINASLYIILVNTRHLLEPRQRQLLTTKSRTAFYVGLWWG